jgi:alanine racemase
MELLPGNISKIVRGKLHGSCDRPVRRVVIDSRKFFESPGTIFVALKGERNNGHQYIPQLLKKGVSCFIVEELPEGPLPHHTAFILVSDSLAALQKLAAWHRGRFSSPVVGITGSNGKTTLKEWIYQAIGDYSRIVRSPQSYNSQVGVPLSLFLLDNTYKLGLIEAGISREREMEKLRKMIRPEIGIFTNLGEAHQENFNSRTEKAIEKLRLFKDVKILIYCSDYQIVDKEARRILPEEKLISWGSSSDSVYHVSKVFDEDYTRIRLDGKVNSMLNCPFKDSASIENCIHLIVFLFEMGYSSAFIQDAILRLEPVSMRLEILPGSNNCTIINDSYNSDLVSLSNALDFLELQTQHPSKTLILSDIYQSGYHERDLYGHIAELIASREIHRVFFIGEGIFANRDIFPVTYNFYRDTEQFLMGIADLSFHNEAILVKGARKFEFERISSWLQESAHRTVMEIDLTALTENYRFFRSLLKPGVKVMAMVKAFSYGSGGVEIANVLQYQNIDYLAVAYADEGVSLRKSGIRAPIMVMSPEINDFNLIVSYNLEPEIYSQRILHAFSSFLKRNAIDEYPVHIKFDTGMHRLGFALNEVERVGDLLQKANLRVVSVFSHLAASDEEVFDAFTREQITLFEGVYSALKQKLGYSFLSHILNTSGIERFPDAQFDMVRLGIGLYGVSNFNQEKLQEVSTLKTTVTQIHTLVEGETVGYGRKGKVKGQMRIATIPIGYADGIPRQLGNGVGKFSINRHIAPVFGSICMDMCMIDVTGIPAEEGDEVIIFGKGWPVSGLAKLAGTIPYELLTSVSERVKRVYYQE